MAAASRPMIKDGGVVWQFFVFGKFNLPSCALCLPSVNLLLIKIQGFQQALFSSKLRRFCVCSNTTRYAQPSAAWTPNPQAALPTARFTLNKRTKMSQTILSPLKAEDTDTLQRLLQLYYFESTTWSKEEVCDDGLYDGCTALDLESYIDCPDAAAYIIRTNNNISGFVMLEQIEIEGSVIWELADLFILPKYRSGWVALEVVRQIIERFEQPMIASTFKENVLAFRFFKAVSKRLQLGSVREIVETDHPEFYSFIINEHAPQTAAA